MTQLFAFSVSGLRPLLRPPPLRKLAELNTLEPLCSYTALVGAENSGLPIALYPSPLCARTPPMGFSRGQTTALSFPRNSSQSNRRGLLACPFFPPSIDVLVNKRVSAGQRMISQSCASCGRWSAANGSFDTRVMGGRIGPAVRRKEDFRRLPWKGRTPSLSGVSTRLHQSSGLLLICLQKQQTGGVALHARFVGRMPAWARPLWL